MKPHTYSTADLQAMSDKELMTLEREIAAEHLGKFPIVSVIWAFTNLAVFLSLWPLVLTGIMPLWLAFPIACVNVALSYLPSHEAQHDIIARPGQKLRWLNEAVGHLSVIPLATSYRALRLTHLEHHANTNHPDKDPDHSTAAKHPLDAIWKTLVNRQPRAGGGFNKYGEVLYGLGTPEAMKAIRDSILWNLFFYSVLFGMAWSGYAIEVALLWWLPRHVGLSYIQYYLSWAPHHPADKTARYGNTRSFKSLLGNIGSLGMQYHIVHHLHPRIPLFRTGPAYWQMRSLLEARGCDVSEL